MNQKPSLADLVGSPELSSYRESLFAQIFSSELLQGCWLASLPPVEIDRPEVDFAGYDLTATCGLVTRHIQLKATRGRIAVHRGLAQKPSACVINLLPSLEEAAHRLTFHYRFFGEPPGEPLHLEHLKPAKKAFHTRDPTGAFSKTERQHHVVVPHARFGKPVTIVPLAKLLFGSAESKTH